MHICIGKMVLCTLCYNEYVYWHFKKQALKSGDVSLIADKIWFIQFVTALQVIKYVT